MTHFRTISAALQVVRLALTRGASAPATTVAGLKMWARTAMLIVSISAFSSNASSLVSLSEQEHQMADQLANNKAWKQTRSESTQSPHPLGVQTLSVELDERKKGSQVRRARVYQFNYDAKQSRLVLIDLDKQVIINQQIINTIHLPLNNVEIGVARALVEQNQTIMQKLNNTRATRGQAELVDLSTIDVKASIFEPDDQTHVCALQRCALISLFDQTRTVFAVEPLVNLTDLSVSTLQQSL